jgi:cell division inhibitor SepF
MVWLGLVDDPCDDFCETESYGEASYVSDEATVVETTDSLQQASSITAPELPANVTKITDISARRTPELRVVPQPEPRPANPELPVVLHAFSYADMELIGKQFRAGKAVVINLTGMSDRNEMRRLIDFSSGMVFALNGRAEKVSSRVFLLVPQGVEVDADFRGRLGTQMARSA